jgi:HEPN domain-containing protein
LSGEFVEILRRRALTLRRLAVQLGGEGELDLAMVMAEQAAQLYIKSFFQ